MHYYQFNIGDYVSSTHHLDEMEDLAYRRMLDLYYSKELPLPSDPKEIARLVRMRSHVECIESVLLEFFELTKDGYRNHGADKVLNNAYDKSEKARLAAKARWDRKNKDLDKESSNADAMQTHSERNATHNTRPITQNPLPSRFIEFWDLYGKKTGKDKCEAKFKKLSKSDIEKIFEVLPEYIKSTPDKQYRKNPLTWLNGKHWEDEINTEPKVNSNNSALQAPNEHRIPTEEEVGSWLK